MTFEPLHISNTHDQLLGAGHCVHPARNEHVLEVICLYVLQYQKIPKNRTNSEADNSSSGRNPRVAISRRPFVETNQTARISLQILAMSKSNPETKTRPVRPELSARPPDTTSELSTVQNLRTSARRPFRCPRVRLSSAGEGVFRVSAGCPQAEISRKSQKTSFFRYVSVIKQ